VIFFLPHDGMYLNEGPEWSLMNKPIDTCQCPSHQIERSQRELSIVLKNLIETISVTRSLPSTHISLVEAQRTLEAFGYKEGV
jgi:hypothetical protein